MLYSCPLTGQSWSDQESVLWRASYPKCLWFGGTGRLIFDTLRSSRASTIVKERTSPPSPWPLGRQGCEWLLKDRIVLLHHRPHTLLHKAGISSPKDWRPTSCSHYKPTPRCKRKTEISAQTHTRLDTCFATNTRTLDHTAFVDLDKNFYSLCLILMQVAMLVLLIEAVSIYATIVTSRCTRSYGGGASY